MSITVTLGNRPDFDAEERRARALRAAEALNGVGWAFDEVITDLTRDLLGTSPEEPSKREHLYFQIDAAAQVKGHLRRIIESEQARTEVNARKHRNDPAADAE